MGEILKRRTVLNGLCKHVFTNRPRKILSCWVREYGAENDCFYALSEPKGNDEMLCVDGACPPLLNYLPLLMRHNGELFTSLSPSCFYVRCEKMAFTQVVIIQWAGKKWPEASAECECVSVRVQCLQTHLRDSHIRDASKCILGDTVQTKVYLTFSIGNWLVGEKGSWSGEKQGQLTKKVVSMGKASYCILMKGSKKLFCLWEQHANIKVHNKTRDMYQNDEISSCLFTLMLFQRSKIF